MTPFAPDLLKAYEVITTLYKKNTPETVSILRRIEVELSKMGYTKFGSKFYRKADVAKLKPLKSE